MSDIIDKIREDRKFFFCVFAFCVFVLLRIFGKLGEQPFEYLAYASLAGYCAFNVGQKVFLALTDRKAEVTP